MPAFDWENWFVDVHAGSRSAPIVLIAEAGINHNGDTAVAQDLVIAAKSHGAHAVKFQKRNPEICVPAWQRDQIRTTPWGQISYLEYKSKIELDASAYAAIDEVARQVKLDWFASAWDLPSQSFLQTFASPLNKVASAMLTHLDFLASVASEQKPTFISTGMSTISDIDTAVEIFVGADCPFILMHSVSTYPASEQDLNLEMIPALKRRYARPIGYSGHEGSLSPSVVAAAMGAVAIERHFTLDRAAWGTDQAASLEPDGLRHLANILRKVPIMRGDGNKRVTAGEEAVAQKLRYWT